MLGDLSPTRQEILIVLKRQSSMTIAQLSALIGIAPTGIRQHLANLERQQYVTSQSVRQKQGRPVMVYRLTQKAEELFPAGYRSLLDRVLDKIQSLYGVTGVQRILRSIMEDLSETYEIQLEEKGLSEKVQLLAGLRNEEGYMSNWQEAEDAFLLLEHHCPIANVAKAHQEVCQHELELFGKLLGVEVEREQHMLVGESHCAYRVRKPADPEPSDEE